MNPNPSPNTAWREPQNQTSSPKPRPEVLGPAHGLSRVGSANPGGRAAVGILTVEVLAKNIDWSALRSKKTLTIRHVASIGEGVVEVLGQRCLTFLWLFIWLEAVQVLLGLRLLDFRFRVHGLRYRVGIWASWDCGRFYDYELRLRGWQI